MKHYMQKLIVCVETKIRSIITDKFALVFGGQITPQAHYVAVFVSFSARNNFEYRCACLTMFSLEDETTQDATKHVNFLRSVLEVFGKTVNNFMALIGHNCAVNPAISDKMWISLRGCARHRFQLVVKEIMADEEQELSQVRNLMRKLRTALLRALLQRHFDLVPRLRNGTRWIVTFKMLKRHIELRPRICAMENEDIDGLLPTVTMEHRLDHLARKLKELDEKTKKPQCADAIIWSARAYFVR